MFFRVLATPLQLNLNDPGDHTDEGSYYTNLLKSGVKLYELRNGSMLHAKTAVIDSIWSTVGSTNMDLLSLMRN
jgi:phosphatidylserine/phosphatidylglycerophosphate/cardiolipin synthase-like enzyme